MIKKLSVIVFAQILFFLFVNTTNATTCTPSAHELNVYLSCSENECMQIFYTEELFMKGVCKGETRIKLHEKTVVASYVNSIVNQFRLENGIFKLTLKEHCTQSNFTEECVKYDTYTKLSDDTSQTTITQLKTEIKNNEQEQKEYFNRLEKKEVISHLVFFIIFMVFPLLIILIITKKSRNHFMTAAVVLISLLVQNSYQIIASVSMVGYKELPLVEVTKGILTDSADIVLKLEILLLIYIIIFRILKIHDRIRSFI